MDGFNPPFCSSYLTYTCDAGFGKAPLTNYLSYNDGNTFH